MCNLNTFLKILLFFSRYETLIFEHCRPSFWCSTGPDEFFSFETRWIFSIHIVFKNPYCSMLQFTYRIRKNKLFSTSWITLLYPRRTPNVNLHLLAKNKSCTTVTYFSCATRLHFANWGKQERKSTIPTH